jgi:enoyl-[acyl-carrier protein] reductase I
MYTIDLSGKNALVLGVANQRSLAWAIAQSLGDAGCRLVLTYQGERLQKNVAALAEKFPDAVVVPCDVTSTEQMDKLFTTIEGELGSLACLVHSIAFARREELEGEFRKTSREGWRIALEISAYSLIDLANRATPLLEKDGNGSILALTYLASQRAVPNYNVMGSAKAALEHCVRQLAFELGPRGIRANAISAGPISTLSARGVSGFTGMLQHNREIAPLRRNVEPEEVGKVALFLASDMASAITGETIFVDAGYNIVGN